MAVWRDDHFDQPVPARTLIDLLPVEGSELVEERLFNKVRSDIIDLAFSRGCFNLLSSDNCLPRLTTIRFPVASPICLLGDNESVAPTTITIPVGAVAVV